MQNFMEKFKKYLKIDEERLGGPHKVYRFPNNYGASVIKTRFSDGGNQGLWELAILRFDNESDVCRLTCATPIANDILGYLTDEDVENTLEQIKNL